MNCVELTLRPQEQGEKKGPVLSDRPLLASL